MRDTLVSIVVPLFNAQLYLNDTLNSIFAQTYPDWECIIVDDGSTDSSKDISKEYCKTDDRFIYYFQSNSGPSVARNLGINSSKGDYILFLDSDDVILPEYLSIMLNESKGVEKNVILYSNLFQGNGDNIYEKSPFSRNTNIGIDISFNDMYRKFGLEFLFIPSCALFPKMAFENVRWNEKLSHSEDWDLYLNILTKNYIFRYFSKPLLIYRNTANSLSKNVARTFEANYSILRNHLTNNNLLFFSKRCAILYKKSIMAKLLRKEAKIVKPLFSYSIGSIRLSIFMFLIYPFTLYFLLHEIAHIGFKKVFNRNV
jgi:glycosyltransferase involved in cell wall biosynthesis